MSITCVKWLRRPPGVRIAPGSGRPAGCGCRRGARRPACPSGTGSCSPTPRRPSSAASSSVAAPRLEAAVLEEQAHLLLGGQRDPVQRRQLVERAGERALHAGAVVAPDPDHERVVELAHLLDRVEDAADVPVGVLGVAGVDLHLARVQPLLRSRRASPRPGTRRSRVSSASAGMTPSSFWRGERLLAQRRPSPRRTCPCTCRPTRAARGAARGCSRSRSRRTTGAAGPWRERGAASRSSSSAMSSGK